MGIKKNFSAPLASGLGAMRRAAVLLLVMLLTTATAWAENVTYIDENGHEQTVDATVLDGNGNTLNQGWFVVSSNVSFDRLFTYSGANIILKDNCTLTVCYDNDYPIFMYGNLTIYGQSGGTGKLVVNTNYSAAICGQTFTFTVNGGIVESKSTDTWGCALSCGSLVFNGGKLKLEGCDGVKGKSNTSKTVTLNWRNATDRVYISGFNNISSVTVGGAGGKCFADADGNYYGGTYTDNFSTLAGKELQPATAYTLTLGSGITTTTEPLFTYSEVDYYTGTVTLGHADRDGYIFGGYTVNGTAIDGNTFTITADATVAATFTPDPAHFSVNAAGTEYTIHTAEGWGVFCDALQDNDTYNRFSGKTVVLGNDIEVSRMAGSQYHDFCGTFDGQGNTLTFNYGTTEGTERVAPFSYVSTTTPVGSSTTSPAVIRRLNVVANITTNGQYAGGIVGEAWGEFTIEHCTVGGTITTSNQFAGGIIARVSNSPLDITDCRSSVTISSSVVNNNNNDGTHGGIAALVASSAKLNISGCVFDGKIVTSNGTTYCGGFVGHNNNGNGGSNVTIANSLYAPAAIADGETEVLPGTGNDPSATFVRNMIASNITNSYYTRQLGTAQGKAPLAVTAGENVTVGVSPVGNPVADGTYSVSGITAYAKGITRTVGETTTFYYGEDDQVSLTLSADTPPEGYGFGGYTASPDGATLTGSANPYTLTMPDADVTVSVMWTAETYTINYNLDGGHLPTGQSNPATYTVETETFTLVNPERDGYAFAGWTGTGLNGATKTVTITQGTTTGNRDYTATWTLLPVSYTDADGNEQTLQPDEFTVLTGGGTTTLSPGWYVVNSDITYTSTVRLGGAVTIILLQRMHDEHWYRGQTADPRRRGVQRGSRLQQSIIL